MDLETLDVLSTTLLLPLLDIETICGTLSSIAVQNIPRVFLYQQVKLFPCGKLTRKNAVAEVKLGHCTTTRDVTVAVYSCFLTM